MNPMLLNTVPPIKEPLPDPLNDTVTHNKAETQSQSPHDHDLGGLDDNEHTYFDQINAADKFFKEQTSEDSIERILAHWRTKYNQILLKIARCEGEETWEDYKKIHKDDPLAIAKYSKLKNLFCVHGFRWCKRFLKEVKQVTLALRYTLLAYVCKSK